MPMRSQSCFLLSYCLPLISYGSEALKLNNYQMHQLNVCWNNAHRRIFRLDALALSVIATATWLAG